MENTTVSKPKKGLRLKFNSPVVLTFSIVCSGVLAVSYVIPGFMNLFSAPSNNSGFNLFSLDVIRLFSHAIGHASFQHLLGNMTFILLLGPILEERYGSGLLLIFMFFTALITGIFNTLFFSTSLLGASGIVFMFILLTSFTNVNRGEIPITFILVAVIYIGQQIFQALQPNQISEFAHIMGGFCGGLFGFLFSGKKEKGKPIEQTISGPGSATGLKM